MSLPQITDDGIGGYVFEWNPDGIRIEATRLKSHTDGRVMGEVVISTTKPGVKHSHLHQAQFNFSSSVSRDRLARSLDGRYGEVDWGVILEQLCVYALERVRRGEPVLTLWSDGKAQPPEFLLEPFLIRDYPTVIFGDPSAFKSSLSLFFYAVLLLPWHDNPLSLIPKGKPTKVLYLDWETEPETIRWQLTRLERGMTLQNIPLSYRRCSLPLAQDIEAVRRAITDSGAEAIVVDSLGLACGGELKESPPSLAFFTALRQLKVTTLILAHTAKNPETKKRSIYGSVFFEVHARSIWEIKKVQEIGEDEIDVALFHRKPPPFQKLYPAIGLNIKFTTDTIVVNQQDVRSVREFVSAMGTQSQIQSLLANGPMNTKEIIEALDASKGSIDMAIKRLKDKNKIVKLASGAFGLAHNE